jgi:hypothetical protein
MEFLDPGWGSGAIRRQRQAQLADILIAISGGEGVEHLAQEFSSLGKQVLPLDLELGASCRDGSGGAPKLFREALKLPDPFFNVRAGESGPELLDRCAARACAITTSQVTGALLRLIDALVPPKAFYVRLLNKDLRHRKKLENITLRHPEKSTGWRFEPPASKTLSSGYFASNCVQNDGFWRRFSG